MGGQAGDRGISIQEENIRNGGAPGSRNSGPPCLEWLRGPSHTRPTCVNWEEQS